MKRFILTSIFCCSFTGSAFAAPPAERIQDRHEIRKDKRELRNDRWDAQRLQHLLNEYKAAAAHDNQAKLGQLDQQFMTELAIELGESHRELADKGREIRQDRRDDDDGRRERRDDQRDRAVEAAHLAKVRSLRQRYRGLLGHHGAAAKQDKQAMITEAWTLARAEIRQDKREKREDRRELRQDRRH